MEPDTPQNSCPWHQEFEWYEWMKPIPYKYRKEVIEESDALGIAKG